MNSLYEALYFAFSLTQYRCERSGRHLQAVTRYELTWLVWACLSRMEIGITQTAGIFQSSALPSLWLQSADPMLSPLGHPLKKGDIIFESFFMVQQQQIEILLKLCLISFLHVFSLPSSNLTVPNEQEICKMHVHSLII